MLKTLMIRNFALMENLTIDFDDGLSIITGETGAGKSIIVQAIATLAGGRIDDFAIRSGKNFAEITGVFIPNKELKEHLKRAGIEFNDELVIRRRIERAKRQNSYINDHLVSLNFLKELAREIIDLVGQYENQSLFYPKTHLALLDGYAGIGALKGQYLQYYNEYLGLQNRLARLTNAARQQDERLDYIKFQIDEIEKANLQPGEEERLNAEKELLQSCERRITLADDLINILYEADGAALENLSKAENLLTELSGYDPTTKDLVSQITPVVATIDDISRQLAGYRQKIEFSGERLDFVLARLDTIAKIKKKYGRTAQEITNYLNNLKEECSSIENKDEEIKGLNEALVNVRKKVVSISEELSTERHNAAQCLEEKILDVLRQLGMEKAQFRIQITRGDLSETGQDEVEFYISTNPGEPLKPLRRIASGGEISRITLALKTILSDVDSIPTVVFDEVDTGIGGRIAESVGKLLATVSRRHQIVCITHLPQISIFADHHYLVKKSFGEAQTFSEIVKLGDEERKMEIARMLGGKKITKKTIEHAAEFLKKSIEKR